MIFKSFLSILFMRFQLIDSEETKEEQNFQFSLWDSRSLSGMGETNKAGGTKLSILFMRFDSRRFNKYVRAGGSFNSLYEIQINSHDVMIHDGKNFQFSLWDSTILLSPLSGLNEYTFNSLYEILLQQLRQTSPTPWAFNSLYELRNMIVNEGKKMQIYAFNSLYEIRWRKQRNLKCWGFSLSILFMRFKVSKKWRKA